MSGFAGVFRVDSVVARELTQSSADEGSSTTFRSLVNGAEVVRQVCDARGDGTWTLTCGPAEVLQARGDRVRLGCRLEAAEASVGALTTDEIRDGTRVTGPLDLCGNSLLNLGALTVPPAAPDAAAAPGALIALSAGLAVGGVDGCWHELVPPDPALADTLRDLRDAITGHDSALQALQAQALQAPPAPPAPGDVTPTGLLSVDRLLINGTLDMQGTQILGAGAVHGVKGPYLEFGDDAILLSAGVVALTGPMLATQGLDLNGGSISSVSRVAGSGGVQIGLGPDALDVHLRSGPAARFDDGQTSIRGDLALTGGRSTLSGLSELRGVGVVDLYAGGGGPSLRLEEGVVRARRISGPDPGGPALTFDASSISVVRGDQAVVVVSEDLVGVQATLAPTGLVLPCTAPDDADRCVGSAFVDLDDASLKVFDGSRWRRAPFEA